MLFSTTQLSRVHHLDDKDHPSFNVEYEGSVIERTTCYKLLGVQFDQHLNWKQHVDKVVKAVNSKLITLKHLKRTANYQLRKQLATLLLSKIDYCNAILSNAPKYRIDKINRLLRQAASFVLFKYCTTREVIGLKWLPAKFRAEFSLLKMAHKAINDEEYPRYLKNIHLTEHRRNTRSTNTTTYCTTAHDSTFAGACSRLLNNLPVTLRKEENYEIFSREVKKFLLDSSLAFQLSIN